MCRKLAAILCKMVSSETLSFTDLFSLGDFRETCHRCWRQYDTTVEYEQLSQPVRCHGSLAGHKVQGHSSKSVHIMALQLKWTIVCVFLFLLSVTLLLVSVSNCSREISSVLWLIWSPLCCSWFTACLASSEGGTSRIWYGWWQSGRFWYLV